MAELDFKQPSPLNMQGSGTGLDFSAGGAPLDFGTGGGLDFSGAPSSYSPTLDPNSASAGFGRGIESLQEDIYGAAEAIGEKFALPYLIQKGKEGRIRNAEEALKYGDPMSFAQVEDLGDFTSWAVTSAASALPYIGAAVPTAIAGMAGGTPLAIGVSALTSAPLTIGGAQIRAKELGGEEAQLSDKGMAGAVALSAAEAVPLVKVFASPFFKKTVQQSIKEHGADATQRTLEGGLKKANVPEEVAKKAATGAVTGASLAIADTAVTETIAHSSVGMDIDSDDFIARLKEAGALGTLLGTPAGGLSGAYQAKNTNAFIDSKTYDPAAKYAQEPSFFGSKTAGRLVNTIVGKPLDNQAWKMRKSEAGTEVHKMVLDDLEDGHRANNAEATDSLYQVEDVARNMYGRKWKDKLLDDYHAGVKNEATAKLKAHYDKLADMGISRGLLKESDKVEGYMSANMDSKRILDNWEDFSQDAIKHAKEKAIAQKKTTKEIEDAVAKTTKNLYEYKTALETDDFSSLSKSFDRISNGEMETSKRNQKNTSDENLADVLEGKTKAKGRMQSDQLGYKQGNLEGHRIFDAPQSFYNKWSVDENKGAHGWEGLQEYTHGVARRIALVDAIGKDGVKLNQKLLQMNKELREKGLPKLTNKEWSKIYDVIDVYEGNYNRIEDPAWKAVSQGTKLMVNMSSLPLVLLGSLTEIFNVAMKTDMSTMIRATANVSAYAGMRIARKMAMMKPSDAHQSRATQMSIAGQTLKQSDHSILSRLTDPNMSKLTAKIGKGFFRVTGLTYWTQIVRNISAESARIRIEQDLEIYGDVNLVGTSGYRDAQTRLATLGISAQEAGVLRTNSGVPKVEKDKIYGRAINKFNRDVVLDPSFADRPIWMSDPNMWMLSQLQGYPTMFTNTVLPLMGKKLKGAPHDVVDGLFIIGAASLLSGMQIAARDTVSGRDQREDGELAMEAVHRQWSHLAVSKLVGLFRADKFGASPTDSVIPISRPVSDVTQAINDLSSGKSGIEEFTKDLLLLTPFRAIKGHFND